MKHLIYTILTFSTLFSFINTSNAQLYGESLDFQTNGSSYIQLSGDNDFGKVTNFQGGFTFEAWVLSEGSKQWSRVFDFGDGENDFIIFSTKSDNGECEFSYRTGGGSRPLLKGGVFPTGWTHVACVLEYGGQASLYLNGELKGTTNWSKSINSIVGTTKNYLGRSQYAHDPYFEGKMDEVRVWKEARTQADIQEWMNCELTGHNENLIGYFKMNQGLSTGPNTSDNFINNFGNLSKNSGILYNFPLAGNNGNWINETPMSSTTTSQNCFELDDADGFIIYNNESNFDYTEAHTFEAWINPNKNDGTRIITIKSNAAFTDYPFYMDYSGSNLFWGQRSSSFNNWAAAYNALEINKWQHVAGVTYEIDGGVKNEIYVDGMLKGEAFHPNQELTQNDSAVKIGWLQQNFRYNGKMSNIRYWNTRRLPSEISQNMSTHYQANTEGLVAQFNTFDNVESSIIDHVGGNLALTIRTPDFSNDPCFVRFVQQPEDQEISVDGGETITFTAQVEDCVDGLLSYQWQKDGFDILGATDQTYSLSSVANSDQGNYTLKVTACEGQVFYSQKAYLAGTVSGSVLSFDGEDDYMLIENTFNESTYTIETWIKFTDDPANQNIIVLSDESGLDSYYSHQIRVNDNNQIEHSTYAAAAHIGELRTVVHPTRIEQDRWYHISATSAINSSLLLSIDGVAASANGIGPLAGQGTKFYVGIAACGYDSFKGEMDELKIWNSNINTFADDELTEGAPNLIHYYNFNNGVANADNTSFSESIGDPYGSAGVTASLHNFGMTGTSSNWVSCGRSIDLSTTISSNTYNDGNSNIFFHSDCCGEAYQWFKNGNPISGATQSYLTVEDHTLEDVGQYHLQVYNLGQCTLTSNKLSIEVEGSGEVINFDGIDDYIEISTFIGTDHSTMLWVKFEEGVTNQNIIHAGDDTGPSGTTTRQLYSDENGYLCYYSSPEGNDGGLYLKSSHQFIANEWTHITVTLDQSNGQPILYVDGSPVTITEQTGNLETTHFNFLRKYYVGSSAVTYNNGPIALDAFNGEMDEIRIFYDIVSPAAISGTYLQELTSTYLISTIYGIDPPTHYLKFSQGNANGDNVVLDNTIIDNKGVVNIDRASTIAHNFNWLSESSNWSDCSPINFTSVFVNNYQENLLSGQDYTLSAFSNDVDTSTLSYQWRKDSIDIEGATNASLILEDYLPTSDQGFYDVIVSDFCSPQFIDTVGVESLSTNCLNNFYNIPINFPTEKTVRGSTDYDYDPFQESNFLTGFCNTNFAYVGPEAIYTLTLADDGVVTLDLDSLDSDIDIFLIGDDCNIDNCFGTGTNTGLQNEHIDAVVSAGTYYIVLESQVTQEVAQPGYFRLRLDYFDGKCYEAQTISCGSTISGNTSTGTTFVKEPCGMSGYLGNELIYEVTLDTSSTLVANLSNLNVDLDLFILDSLCQDVTCIAQSTNEETFDENIIQGLPAGTYYIVVDGKEGVEGSFDLFVDCNDYFEASVDDNDAYIDLDWSIDKSLCVPQDTGIIIRIVTTPNTILFEQEFYTAALTPDIIDGTYRHYVGTDHSRLYKLRVYNRLTNKIICDILRTGSTTPFQKPEILDISEATNPDSIKITWRNLSKLSDQFRIYRDGQIIENLSEGYTEDSLVISYVDVHDINNLNSIHQDSSYQYCIETFSAQLNQTYADTCAIGSTFDINFMASDFSNPENINLTWNNISSFCEYIKIERNGIFLTLLSNNEISYNDMAPIYGVPTSYQLTLMEGDNEIMEAEDIGNVAPNGSISGMATTDQGNYPIAGATVILSKNIVGTATTLETTLTDYEGKYSFNDIVYGLSTDFEVSINKTGNQFDPETKAVTLNEAIFELEEINFNDILPVEVTEVDDIVTDFTHNVLELEDYISLDWAYVFDASDTTFFNLYRNGNPILNTNDANGEVNTYSDYNGVPDSTYQYILQVHKIVGGIITTQELNQEITYPSVTPLSNMDIILGEGSGETKQYDPSVILDWKTYGHLSKNFDGYRIFRDGVEVGVLDTTQTRFSHLAIPGSSALYQVKAYRILNGIVYESQPYPTNPISITSNNLWSPNIGSAVGRDIVLNTIDVPSGVGGGSIFYANATYNGVQIERKIQSEDDSTYELLDEFKKSYIVNIASTNDNAVYRDERGVPDENYTYRLSTYINIDGEVYTQSSEINITCPAIEGPSNFAASEEEGLVSLSWDSNQSGVTGSLSLGYINYEGYEITRSAVGGGVENTITTLSGNKESFNDYISNPVYDIFFDAYTDVNYNYQLKAYLDIDGVRYYAAPLTLSAMPTPGSSEEPLPTNFMASDDLPGHIKLCWDWTAAKQSEFIVYRDSTLLGILPYTSRSFYDYNAPEGISTNYIIQSRHLGEFSQEVRTQGLIPTFVTISGRIYNDITGQGLPNVNVSYNNKDFSELDQPNFAFGTFKDAVATDSTGRYVFTGVPNVEGLSIKVEATRINTDFDSSELVTLSSIADSLIIAESNEYILDFIDYSSEVLSNNIANVIAVNAESNMINMNVPIHWSVDNVNYDGFKIYRGDNVIGEVLKGEGFTFIDINGFPGIQFPYGVQAFQTTESGRIYSEIKSDFAIFPAVPPVVNLTATPFVEKNLMKLAWSHPLDNHDVYTISRNGLYMTNIEAGTPMMWYDSTGIPGINYVYEVIAVNGNYVSDPVAVSKRYKGVGEVTGLVSSVNNSNVVCPGVFTSDNHVAIFWNYMPEAAQGFEVYRDNKLIATIDSTILSFGNAPLSIGDTLFTDDKAYYKDFEGIPGQVHEYHVIAYVIRNNARYTSGIEELFLSVTAEFPQIAKVEGLNITQNNILGSVDIAFTYEAQIVKGFEVIRDGIVLDTILATNSTDYYYQDVTGSPGVMYEYAVKVFDIIDGLPYYSPSGCEVIVEYPIVPIPQNLSASQGEFQNHIEVEWIFGFNAFADSFYVENITLGIEYSFGRGTRGHIELVNTYQYESYDFRIRAARIIEGELVFSQWSEKASGWASNQITGNENEYIIEGCDSGNDGYATDIDGEWAVSGSINGEASITIYRMINGGWSIFQTIVGPLGFSNGDFGSAVAIHGDHIVVGAPGRSRAYIYHFNGVEWGNPQTFLGRQNANTNFGYAVDIHNGNCIIGEPVHIGAYGKVHIYVKENGVWSETYSFTEGNSLRMGSGVSISDSVAVATLNYLNISKNGIVVFEKLNGNWTRSISDSKAYPVAGRYTEVEGLTKDNVDLKDNKLVIGDSYFVGAIGEIIVMDFYDGNITNQIKYHPTEIGPSDYFGHSVAVDKIKSPEDEKTYIAVGVPYFDNGGFAESGKSYLLKLDGGVIDIVSEYTPDPLADNRNGWSVALSESSLMIGSPTFGGVNGGLVEFHNHLVAPTEVSATDGISLELDPTRVTIDWTFSGNQELLSGFNIYRDDELLIYRDKATTSEVGNTLVGQWEDNTGGAGQVYVYTVKATNNNIPIESYGTSDKGHTTANGKIQGSVTTAGNNVAVPGVTITATGIVDGELYTYTGTTFSNGEYILTDVYYDHDDAIATEYTLTAAYLDHIINPAGTNIATLNSLIDPTVGTVSFIDETAFVVYGKVEQPLVACAIEGIKVTPIINGTPNLLSQTTTDSDGNYSLVVNPNDPSLLTLAIRIENEAVDGLDTLYYGFKPDADTLFTDFINFPFALEINYQDTLTYPVSIRVKNTCDDPISIAKWDVRIRTLNGCFDEIYETNSSGNLEVDLLPLNYEMIVIGTSVPSTVNQVALDYFANFPVKLNLFDLHRDTLDQLSPFDISELIDRNFTYHVAPDIEVTGFTNLLCDTEVAILQQGESYTLSFDITEQFGSKQCSVQEGKVRILNPASDQSGSTEIPYDTFLEQFGSYTFTAGSPNQIRPHFYTITIDYLSDDNIFLGRTQQLAFVEGSIGLPGAGIITDPVDGNNTVPLPIMVLRDPPGDGSSSYISGGQSVTYETELVKEFGGQTEISVSAEVEVFSANAEFGFTNVLGGSDENTNTYSNTLTLSQTISTFDPVDIQDETLTGVNADIVVGQGLVMSYGKVYDYSISCDMVMVTEKNNIAPGAASTTWHYTVSQINNIILGFENDSIKIQNGDLILTEGNRPITRDQSLIKIGSYLENWRQVLRFHSNETIPMYNLCTTRPPIEGGYPNAVGEIEKWKTDVCAELGAGINETFVLADIITWNDPLMDKYSAATLAIRNIASGIGLPIWNHTTNYQGIIDQATNLGQLGSYGKPIENITVGGGIAIERSIQNVSSSTRSHTSNFYTTNEVSAAAGVDNEVTIVIGAFAGVGVGVFTGGFSGVLMESSVVKTKAGIKGTFEFKKSNTTSNAIENEIETGYTLSDDDSVDAFSVTVIQPIAQNHTPYFEFFGGFTSCPAEEGAIFVDNPKIAIVQGGGTTDELLIQNIAEDELIQLDIIIENQTPISSNPEREVKVYLDPGTNVNGALLTLNGVDLNNGELVLTLDAFDPVTLSLVIERGPLFYEYDNLKLVIEPTCDASIQESVDISVRYNSPCSPVTLVQPDEGWLVNDNITPLVIAIQDYDPYNEVLKKAILEYRKIGSQEGWDLVNKLQILQGNEIPADTLAAYNEGLDATIQNPKFYFTWTIPEDFVDGEYEVRARMNCDFSNTYSNVIKGTLARNEIGLFGNPQPADQVWTDGDEISFSFNLPLDCSYIQGPTAYIEEFISIVDETTGLPVDFSVSCFNNKLQFVLAEEMSTYDGHFLTMSVDEVPSETGNISSLHEWTFRVITQKVYWANGDTIKLRMYQDEDTEVMANLINNDGLPIGEILSLIADDGNLDSWIQVVDPTTQPFDLSPEGRTVTFDIVANVGLGTYNETIDVAGVESFGNTPQLHIQLEVLNRPPNWEVDPNDYSQSMNLVANWKFDDQDLVDVSTDTTDIISVWIDSEIRGVANIISADGYHYAYITVYGNTEDGSDTPLEFRIWDGDPGTEYDGHVNPEIQFIKDTQVGTVGTPIILNVNEEDDLARYIPLNGNGQWTGFSLFTDTEDMSVIHKLRSLKYETEGDIILTGNQFAQYNDSIGWYSFGDEALMDLNTSDGYMIYLQGAADTLRVSGALTAADNIDLQNGWNWMGFPFEISENVNLSFTYPAANGLDKLKKDTPLPGASNQTAQYNPGNQSWQGNLPTMEPNNLYKLYVSNPNPTELDWIPDGENASEGAPTSLALGIVADPDDQETWSSPSFNSDAVMPIVAQVLSGGIIATNPDDRVAIFEADTLRGYASPVYLPEFDTYQFSILLEEGEGVYDIQYYDAASDIILSSTNTLVYNASGEGTYDLPYEILFEDGPCPTELILGPSGVLFDSNTTYEAGQIIRVRGTHNIPSGIEIIFDAPLVIFEGQVTPLSGSNVIVKPDGCN